MMTYMINLLTPISNQNNFFMQYHYNNKETRWEKQKTLIMGSWSNTKFSEITSL